MHSACILLCSARLEKMDPELTMAPEEQGDAVSGDAQAHAISVLPRDDEGKIAASANAAQGSRFCCIPEREPRLRLVKRFEKKLSYAMDFVLPPHVSPLKGFAAVVALLDSKVSKQ